MDKELEEKRDRAKAEVLLVQRTTCLTCKNISDYHDALEADHTRLTDCAAYLAGKLSKAVALLATSGCGPYLRPHGLGKKPFMNFRDRLGHAGPAAGDEHGLGVVEELAQPPVTAGPLPVEVDGEPEALLQAAGVEGGEQFGGLGVEETLIHEPPKECSRPHSLTAVVERIRTELEHEFADQYVRIMTALDGSDFRMLADLHERWKVDAVRRFATRLKDALNGAIDF